MKTNRSGVFLWIPFALPHWRIESAVIGNSFNPFVCSHPQTLNFRRATCSRRLEKTGEVVSLPCNKCERPSLAMYQSTKRTVTPHSTRIHFRLVRRGTLTEQPFPPDKETQTPLRNLISAVCLYPDLSVNTLYFRTCRQEKLVNLVYPYWNNRRAGYFFMLSQSIVVQADALSKPSRGWSSV